MAISALISKFITNDFFKKMVVTTIAEDSLFPQEEFSIEDNFFKEIYNNYEKPVLESLLRDSKFGVSTKQGIFYWIEHMNISIPNDENLANQ